MKKIVTLLSLLLVLGSCATIVPHVDCTSTPTIDDQTYRLDLQSIDASQLSAPDKIAARADLLRYYQYKKRLNSISDLNKQILDKNIELNNRYSTWDGIVGGVGGLSAIATVVASWSVVVPIASGTWNVIGLVVQKNNVTPKVNDGMQKAAQYSALIPAFNSLYTKFQDTVTATTPADATRLFAAWRVELGNAINDANQTFGCVMSVI